MIRLVLCIVIVFVYFKCMAACKMYGYVNVFAGCSQQKRNLYAKIIVSRVKLPSGKTIISIVNIEV